MFPRSKQTIPGLGLQLPGDKGIRVMAQYDKEDSPAPKGLDKTIVDIDPEKGVKLKEEGSWLSLWKLKWKKPYPKYSYSQDSKK